MKPVLYAFFAAALWGLWWIPIRYLESAGLPGALGGMAMNAGALLACLLVLATGRVPVRLSTPAILGAALAGIAVTSYSVALNHADVVRVILLFYLAPVWSKIIEWAFMAMPWRWHSTLALMASLGGAVLVLGGEVSADAAQIGDILAVGSGLAWAAGAALIFSRGESGAVALTGVTAFSAVLLALLFVWLGGVSPAVTQQPVAMMSGLGLGVVYVLPILLLTLWSAQRLPPATLSFLLTAEILSGIISGALLLDEPFGMMQVTGACLIIAGALGEVLPGLLARRRDGG